MKVKPLCGQAHAYCEGTRDAMQFALTMLEQTPDRVDLVKDALRQGITRQEQSMKELEVKETEQ